MGFWDLFKVKENHPAASGQAGIYYHLQELLPTLPEEELIKVACLAGLLARVAHTDLDITDEEVCSLKTNLAKWTSLAESEIEAITTIAVSQTIELAGLENYKYCSPLNDLLDTDTRYAVLKSLFAVAASDGTVSGQEEEEIRVITKGLLLSHKHFISARASVIAYLSSLKKR